MFDKHFLHALKARLQILIDKAKLFLAELDKKPLTLKIKSFLSRSKQAILSALQHTQPFFKQIQQRIAQIYSVLTAIFKKLKAIFLSVFLPLLEKAHSYLKPIITLIKGHVINAAQKCWAEIRELKIRDHTVGAYVDTGVEKALAYPLVRQLIEATRNDTRIPTMVSTAFINILALVFPMTLMQVYDRIIPNRTLSTLVFLTIGVVLTFAIEALFRIIRAYINLWADTKYEFALEKMAFSKVMNAPMYVTENTDVGMRLKQFTILEQLKGFYNTQLLTSLYEIPFLFIFLFAIAYLAGWLFLIPLAVTFLTGYITWRFTQNWKTLLEKKITFEARESDFIINVLTGIHTAKSIGMEELLIRRHERLQESGMDINYHTSVHDGDLHTIKSISSQAITVLIVTFGAIMVINGGMAIGGLAACTLLAGRIMRPFDHVLSTLSRLTMIDLLREKLDLIFQLPASDEFKKVESTIAKGEITLQDIGFHYGDSTYDILKAVDLSIPAQQLVGITGENQSEKTALLNILATIAKPTSGVYLIDGKNVDEYQTSALHKKIAYLNRVGKLFRGTIMDNLSAFNEEYVPNARRLVDRLGLNSILSKLPSGYDTFVGEKAVEALPGGVMNMIFIVRALVSKPKIVLFDETNINLDTQSSQNMINLLVQLKEFSTVIVLASKQSTIDLMDVLYTFQDKKLIRVENGK